MQDTPPSLATRLSRCLNLGCAALLALVLGGGLFLWALGPTYPRQKRAAFDRLRQVGPERVVAEGRALMTSVRGVEERVVLHGALPPLLVELGAVDAHVASRSVYLRMGGGGLVGDFGFWVRAEGERLQGPRVAEGLEWFEAYDAPESMRGLPAGW